MKKLHLLGAACACLSILAFSINVNAAIVTYTDRAQFESALSSYSIDNLDGVAPFGNTSYVRNDYTFLTTAGAGSYGCINHQGCGDNSVKGFDDAYLWNYEGEDTFTFNSPVHGLGFDYANPVNQEKGTVPILEGISASSDSGFFGVISDVALTTFTFDQSGAGVNYLLTDNITYGSVSVSAVPIPAAVWLFGSGLLGLVGVARRKKTA